MNRTDTDLPIVNEEATAIAVAAYAPWHQPGIDMAGMRRGFDQMLPEPAADVSVTEGSVGGAPGRWVAVPESGEVTVLYLHGGGGTLGSSYAYRDLASRIARSGGARVFVPDYALAPENPFPAGLNDVRAAYDGLVQELGGNTEKLVVAGDSAGGGMAVSTVATVLAEKKPLPAAVVALSPFTDMTLSGESMTRFGEVDRLISRAAAEQMSGAYLAGHDPRDPRVSPVFADFTGYPPLLVQVGACELLLDDSVRLAEAVKAAGGQVELQVADGLFHVFHMFAAKLPEAQRALEDVGAFIRTHTR
ncbi:alpha/beta hydrolase fold domain-containing protein [Mycolicibacterium thermoresistibile]